MFFSNLMEQLIHVPIINFSDNFSLHSLMFNKSIETHAFIVIYFAEFVLQKNVQKATWVTGRLALSQQSSRFTLPIDMARLERKSP